MRGDAGVKIRADFCGSSLINGHDAFELRQDDTNFVAAQVKCFRNGLALFQCADHLQYIRTSFLANLFYAMLNFVLIHEYKL